MTSLRADLGEYLKEQRHSAQLTLRQLAEVAGVSNPYLSQIERGLKKPSAEILQSLAKGLRISAESLYVRAGILDEQDPAHLEVQSAILGDRAISERQKRVLLDIYAAFTAENARTAPEPGSTAAGPSTTSVPSPAEPVPAEPAAEPPAKPTVDTAAAKTTRRPTRRSSS